ncbi:Conserved_hypothetical protein [Hexamita inflata]|uniref:Uncharacterized protein n=1 Tax=Hexamita inflata TaxID=28002 RepID=A0AA86NVE2_9EUKA|nr:Conserved hypothetical protein [Hexamita inflata]CAI9925811.1 Conserved hypothetical protein [Hexamita inflata]
MNGVIQKFKDKIQLNSSCFEYMYSLQKKPVLIQETAKYLVFVFDDEVKILNHNYSDINQSHLILKNKQFIAAAYLNYNQFDIFVLLDAQGLQFILFEGKKVTLLFHVAKFQYSRYISVIEVENNLIVSLDTQQSQKITFDWSQKKILQVEPQNLYGLLYSYQNIIINICTQEIAIYDHQLSKLASKSNQLFQFKWLHFWNDEIILHSSKGLYHIDMFTLTVQQIKELSLQFEQVSFIQNYLLFIQNSTLKMETVKVVNTLKPIPTREIVKQLQNEMLTRFKFLKSLDIVFQNSLIHDLMRRYELSSFERDDIIRQIHAFLQQVRFELSTKGNLKKFNVDDNEDQMLNQIINKYECNTDAVQADYIFNRKYFLVEDTGQWTVYKLNLQ